jgi:hypothetical protein
MAQISRQIGWGTESNLLYQILKQLNKLTSILFNLKESTVPKYKVFTALLTQSGGDDLQGISSGPVTKGVTYQISASDGNFSNVGAPSNDDSTWFVAINNEIPNSYGTGLLKYNTGAPVVTVLENTIGNIWFTYDGVGNYGVNSNNLFTGNKTASFISSLDGAVGTGGGSPLGSATSINNVNNSLMYFVTTDSTGTYSDNLIDSYPIEIRVYN